VARRYRDLVTDEWRVERDRAAAVRGEALARQRAVEAGLARELIEGFIEKVRETGPEAEGLTAYPYDGKGRYKTKVRGWYLNNAKTVAIDEEGNYYSLGVPGSLKARVTGVELKPQEPKLIIGEGARDGESMPLKAALQRVLDRVGK
jgi:hypothetical protein